MRTQKHILTAVVFLALCLNVSSQEAQVMRTAEQISKYSSQIAAITKDEIWPGFDLVKYIRLEQQAGVTRMRFTNEPNNPTASIFMVLGDDYYLQHTLEEDLELTFHEAFHGFERDPNRPGVKWRTENSLLVAEYPITSARANALFNIEARILFSALQAADKNALKAKARQFIAVRKLRQGELEPRFVDFEKGAESNEGLAEYAGVKAVVAAMEATKRNRIFIPFQNLDGRTYLIQKFDKLKNINAAGRNARLRFYYTGSAQGLLLDRLVSDWKRKVQVGGTPLQDLVEKATENQTASKPTSLESILREYGYQTILKEEQEAASKKEAERQALLDSVLNQQGRRYVIDVSALEKMGGMRGFDPMNVTMIKQKRIHMKMLKVGDAGVYLAEFSQPVVEDSETRQYTTISKDPKPEILVDGAPLDPAKSAEERFEKKMTIRTTGFIFEAYTGVVTITEREILVRLAPRK